MDESISEVRITYFAPHPEELADKETSEPSTSIGIFGNIFNRIFKSHKDGTYITDTTYISDSTSITESEKNESFIPDCQKEKFEVSQQPSLG
ncbi:unnamed protein product [Thelazia callipaeda]|uniref:Uncharacterized protein n=1 Tax=Thelazia callipaeda TaxID=103827 RepID=A0A0N5CS32_THECL|nr:unnamed protein product [Thelazia callipaeda]